MAKMVEEGQFLSPKQVYREVAENEKHQDDISRWVRARKQKGLCVPPTRQVQLLAGKISEWCFANHETAFVMDFLKGGDCWVIANALANKASKDVVVTRESAEHPKAKVIRIPDVCKKFGVRCINRPTLVTELNPKL